MDVIPPGRCSPFKIQCKDDLIRLEIFAQVCNYRKVIIIVGLWVYG